ncbi:NAD(P)-dependent oxidoreductase [Okibacterium endophyticum]
MEIAVLGLGEAGRVYAEGLARRGMSVSGFDPALSSGPICIAQVATSLENAVRDADLVLSIVGSAAAESAASQAFSAMRPGAMFADMNTATPELMMRLASAAERAGIRFVDVAIMAPVPRAGVNTPLLASGTGAEGLITALSDLSLPIENLGPKAGASAGLKLLRSVFMKGLAGLVFESVTAAEKVGAADWMRSQIAAELGPDGKALVERLVSGTLVHAPRRAHEMHDAHDYLETLGTPTWMTAATTEWLEAIAKSPSAPAA